ncbi:hypothetical protein ElyMa_006664600 [Elysia marginata]|uniref:Uncharacterized protein n=1 Tax=Elysia marginata TaxID=1093978 RepID=A0AAV4ILB6_9GAST|nr:hypothetical protein ElyMa_006664600 [Elysia marginata]
MGQRGKKSIAQKTTAHKTSCVVISRLFNPLALSRLTRGDCCGGECRGQTPGRLPSARPGVTHGRSGLARSRHWTVVVWLMARPGSVRESSLQPQYTRLAMEEDGEDSAASQPFLEEVSPRYGHSKARDDRSLPFGKRVVYKGLKSHCGSWSKEQDFFLYFTPPLVWLSSLHVAEMLIQRAARNSSCGYRCMSHVFVVECGSH